MTILFHYIRMFVLACLMSGCAGVSAQPYYPPPNSWEHRKPSELGMDDAKIAEAVTWALTQETDMPRDFSTQEKIFGKLLGPIPSTRAPVNGIILCKGYIIAEFGEKGATSAADPTYSVAKSYLSTLTGLTIDRGLIKEVHDPVAKYIHDGGYDSAHNAKITWHHHVTQSSEWQGELFGKTSTFIGKEAFGSSEMKAREIREPGSHYEYNDVRINRLALSLLRLWKRPLSDVLKTEIMDPIGASTTWSYRAYDNAIVDVDGTPMPSISGGTRWGGGLWMNSFDHARFGLLISRDGKWNDKQVISSDWITQATKQQGVNTSYGYLWWLNNEGRWPAAPKSSFCALGAGSNTIWIDNDHDLVVVWRWHKGGDAQNEFYKKILAAINPVTKPIANPPNSKP